MIALLCSEAVAVNRNMDQGVVSVLKCKRWSCEICQPMLRWKVMKAATRGRPTAMLTLTCQPDLFDTPDQAARRMVKALASLRKALAREKGIKKLPMIAVFEKHKSGWPHLHILLRTKFISQKWLSEKWESLTGAFIVGITKIPTIHGAAQYVAKYIGKDLASFAGCKRWWRSHDYEVDPEDVYAKVRYGQFIELEYCKTFAEMLSFYRNSPNYYVVEEGKSWFHFTHWSFRKSPG